MIQPNFRGSILRHATTQFEQDRVSKAHTIYDLRLRGTSCDQVQSKHGSLFTVSDFCVLTKEKHGKIKKRPTLDLKKSGVSHRTGKNSLCGSSSAIRPRNRGNEGTSAACRRLRLRLHWCILPDTVGCGRGEELHWLRRAGVLEVHAISSTIAAARPSPLFCIRTRPVFTSMSPQPNTDPAIAIRRTSQGSARQIVRLDWRSHRESGRQSRRFLFFWCTRSLNRTWRQALSANWLGRRVWRPFVSEISEALQDAPERTEDPQSQSRAKGVPLCEADSGSPSDRLPGGRQQEPWQLYLDCR